MTGDVHPLDPVPGPAIPFRRAGRHGWTIGNRPSRLALEIIEDEDGRTLVEIDPITGESVEDDE